MSTRIHIGDTDNEIFDYVLTRTKRVVAIDRPPFRLRIRDVSLFWQSIKQLENAAARWGCRFPEHFFTVGLRDLEPIMCPTFSELLKYLSDNSDGPALVVRCPDGSLFKDHVNGEDGNAITASSGKYISGDHVAKPNQKIIYRGTQKEVYAFLKHESTKCSTGSGPTD